MELSEKQRDVIEKIGVRHEMRGMQPVNGRIIGLFLVNDETEVTFDEIQEKLGISKSGVSQALNFLQARNLVEYITKPGDRKRYFRLKTIDWRADFANKFIKEMEFAELIGEILEIRTSKTEKFNNELREVKQLLEHLKVEIPKVIDNFFENRKVG